MGLFKMNKYAALSKYEAATRLGYRSTQQEWLAVFPTAESLARFRADVGGISFPENFGSSPWDFAFGVAYKVGEGFSPTSRDWYAKQIEAKCPYCTAEAAAVALYAPDMANENLPWGRVALAS